jgi:pantoate--beta-alanine ligase
MGALHTGHISLIEKSVYDNDITVVSIFVNPIQFDDASDLASYPQTFEADSAACEQVGADYIFMPSALEMYPEGFSLRVSAGDDPAEKLLCASGRKGHFDGVLTVVCKLFGIVQPDKAYFGEKDFQQLYFVKKMVRELNMPMEIVPCPTVREADGLTMSSRNVRLGEKERATALCLSRALGEVRKIMENSRQWGRFLCLDELQDDCKMRHSGESRNLTCDNGTVRVGKIAAFAAMTRSLMNDIIESEPLAILEYAEVLDADSLQPVSEKTESVLLAVAAEIGGVRLIDNMVVKV